MRRRALAALVGCLALLGAPATAETICGSVVGKPLPITSLRTGLGAVPAMIGNRDVKLVIDTGAAFSLLDDHLATELRLPRSTRSNASLFAGARITEFVDVSDLRLGDLNAVAERFGLFSQLANDGVQGTLGAPALAHSAFEMDFPGHQLRLIAPSACGRGPDSWTFSPIASVSWRQSGSQIWFMATLDGEDLLTVLDSGADHSSIVMHTATSQLGLSTRDLGDLGMHRINGNDVHIYSHSFATLEIGAFQLPTPEVQIVAIPHQKRGPQLILGADFLRRVRVYIDWRNQKLHIAPPLQ